MATATELEEWLEQLCRFANGQTPEVLIHPVVRAITNLHAHLKRKAKEVAVLGHEGFRATRCSPTRAAAACCSLERTESARPRWWRSRPEIEDRGGRSGPRFSATRPTHLQ
jgi:hypothetical protein